MSIRESDKLLIEAKDTIDSITSVLDQEGELNRDVIAELDRLMVLLSQLKDKNLTRQEGVQTLYANARETSKAEKEDVIFDMVEDDFPRLRAAIVDALPAERIFTTDQLRIPIISITNSQPHPTRHGYEVYHFKKLEEAEFFQSQLDKYELFYERHDEVQDGVTIYWFGIRSQDQEKVDVANYTAKGMYRKPLIQDNYARYFIIGLGIALLAFALFSALMNS